MGFHAGLILGKNVWKRYSSLNRKLRNRFCYYIGGMENYWKLNFVRKAP
jgi:hypothetical protein